ncbi:MAG TPA: hypothetical protein VFF52_10310 [Isosphaeraceae bacterium]|nr:hypothetical protein [Isosphaeraceae bacterium]
MPVSPIPDHRAEGDAGALPGPCGPAEPAAWTQRGPAQPQAAPRPYEPPLSALGPLFRCRLERIHACRVDFVIDINTRPTTHVLGGYYKSRRLVRVYARDRKQGRRPLHELFDTFLHEVAHHLEYTEPQSFAASGSRRVPGRMHSRLFWRILGELKQRWADLQAQRRR